MTVGRGPRLGADGVNAINEELVGRGLRFWLLAPQSGVWKLLGQPAGRWTSRITSGFRLRASWAELRPKNEFESNHG